MDFLIFLSNLDIMSISKPDTFLYYEQWKTKEVEPILTIDLHAGYFQPMWLWFETWFMDIIFNRDGGKKEYPLLYNIFSERHDDNSHSEFIEILKRIASWDDELLKEEFYILVSGMEATIKEDDNINKQERRGLCIWNGLDFHTYVPSFITENEWRPLNELLWFRVKWNEDDWTKTLEDELIEDISIIAKRTNEILWRRAIGENWEILDNTVSIFSSLDWWIPGEVFLKVNDILIDGKPPKWTW